MKILEKKEKVCEKLIYRQYFITKIIEILNNMCYN